MAEWTCHAKQMSFSVDALDMDEGQELSYHILDQALELGETFSLPTDWPAHNSADYFYDDHCISLITDLAQQTNPAMKQEASILEHIKGSTKTPTSHSDLDHQVLITFSGKAVPWPCSRASF